MATKDYNIPPEHTEQLEAWRGVESDDFFKVYEGLTHPLIKYDPIQNQVADHVDSQLLDELTAWLSSQDV